MKVRPKCVLIAILGVWMCAGAGLSHAEPSYKARQKPFFEMQALFNKTRLYGGIIVARDGTVLAFAKDGNLRRSRDGGKTWGTVQKLQARGFNAVVDQNSGDILLVYPGGGWLLRSRDNGKTWEKESIVVKPNAAGHGPSRQVSIVLNTSETGITLQFGKHKGRLLMPGRCEPPKGRKGDHQDYWQYDYNCAIYSDDGGKTWQTSHPVQTGTGEGALAELSDGRIYYNSRSHMSVDHRRRIAWSHDGGFRWVEWQVSNDLFEVGGNHYYKYSSKPSYGCRAGLVRIPSQATGGKDVLLFSMPDNPGAGDKDCRVRMTVWASFDGAKTWPVKRLIDKGPSSYSSLAADKNGTIYLLFENGRWSGRHYDHISLARFNLEWVTAKQK